MPHRQYRGFSGVFSVVSVPVLVHHRVVWPPALPVPKVAALPAWHRHCCDVSCVFSAESASVLVRRVVWLPALPVPRIAALPVQYPHCHNVFCVFSADSVLVLVHRVVPASVLSVREFVAPVWWPVDSRIKHPACLSTVLKYFVLVSFVVVQARRILGAVAVFLVHVFGEAELPVPARGYASASLILQFLFGWHGVALGLSFLVNAAALPEQPNPFAVVPGFGSVN